MINAVKELWKAKGIVTVLYLLSAITGLLFAMQFYETLIAKANNSLNLNGLLKDFDYMVFADALVAFKTGLEPYFLKCAIVVAISFLINSFLSGGIVDAVIIKKFKVQRFLISSWRSWPKTLLLIFLLFILFIFLASTAVLIGYFFHKTIPAHDHRILIIKYIPPVIFMLSSFVLIFLLWDYSRVYIHKNIDVLTAIIKSFRQIFTTLYPLKIFISVTVLRLLGLGLYLFIDYLLGMTSMFTVLLMVLIQQTVQYFSIYMRILHLKLAYSIQN